MPSDGVRLDSALAFYNDRNDNSGGFAAATVASGAYKLLPNLALMGRLGMVNNNPPAGAPGATSLVNPLFGSIYVLPLSDPWRLAFFLGFTLPIGSGGGDTPDAPTQAANSAGILTRFAMDNALFAVNYFTLIPGIDIAYIADGFTLQLETTLLQLTRVRGEQVDRDASRTNFTSGLEIGYAISSSWIIQGELKCQAWLSNDTVKAASNPATQNLSFAIGPRFTWKTEKFTMRPSIAYGQGISGPIASGGYSYQTNSDKIIFIDIPFIF
jgi:hypothetical protein